MERPQPCGVGGALKEDATTTVLGGCPCILPLELWGSCFRGLHGVSKRRRRVERRHKWGFLGFAHHSVCVEPSWLAWVPRTPSLPLFASAHVLRSR